MDLILTIFGFNTINLVYEVKYSALIVLNRIKICTSDCIMVLVDCILKLNFEYSKYVMICVG